MLSPQTEKLSSSCPKPQMASVMLSAKWLRVGFIEVCSRKSIGGSSLIRMSSRPTSREPLTLDVELMLYGVGILTPDKMASSLGSSLDVPPDNVIDSALNELLVRTVWKLARRTHLGARGNPAAFGHQVESPPDRILVPARQISPGRIASACGLPRRAASTSLASIRLRTQKSGG